MTSISRDTDCTFSSIQKVGYLHPCSIAVTESRPKKFVHRRQVVADEKKSLVKSFPTVITYLFWLVIFCSSFYPALSLVSPASSKLSVLNSPLGIPVARLRLLYTGCSVFSTGPGPCRFALKSIALCKCLPNNPLSPSLLLFSVTLSVSSFLVLQTGLPSFS